MLLGRLWHGAAWTFVAWGALHGVALALHKLWAGRRLPALPAPLGWAATMAVVFAAWVFFRAPDFATAFGVLSALVSWRGGLDASGLGTVLGLVALLLAIDLPQRRSGSHSVAVRWPWAVRGAFYAAAILLLVAFHGNDVPFIYFQF